MKTNLIQTTDYLLLIDEKEDIKRYYSYYLKDHKYIVTYMADTNSRLEQNETAIIAYYPLTKEAKELDLPLLPPFKEDEFSKYYQIVFDYVNSGVRNFGAMMGLFKLKEIAQSKQFSLEDMKKAFEYGKSLEPWDSFEDFIKSLSTRQLPKEFKAIYQYENEKGVIVDTDRLENENCKLKTITNSEGKEELVGEYKY